MVLLCRSAVLFCVPGVSVPVAGSDIRITCIVIGGVCGVHYANGDQQQKGYQFFHGTCCFGFVKGILER